MKTPAKIKVSKLRNLFEKPVGDKYKSGMVKGGKGSKKGGGGEMASTIRQQLFGGGPSRANHNISTSDQEEDFISIKSRSKKTYTLAVKQPGTQDKEDNVAASLEAILVDKEAGKPPGTPRIGKVTAEKRPRDESDSEGDVGELESNFINDIKRILDKGGAGHMFGPIKDRFMEFVDKLLKRQATKIKSEMGDIRKKEQELDKCSRSIIIHNANMIAMEDDNDYINYNLAEKVTETLHTMCRSMICVMEAYPMGQWKDGKPPTSVCVVLGSPRQKGVIFRTIAGNMRAETAIGKALKGVAIRDCFPKELIPDSQRLFQKGMMLKKNGQVELFKVVARGPGVIPVLEVRKKANSGGLTKWEVFETQMKSSQPAVEKDVNME